ncbi:MAG: hypothetical protein ACJ75H_21950 [Thermoanaerobaculia bacterium]
MDNGDPEDEARFLSIPVWQREILNERLADLQEYPEAEESWDEVKAEIQNSRSNPT